MTVSPLLFGSLTFLNPWILAGLIFLPALWILLRVMPPAPRLVVFPAARFLEGLEPDDHTTTKTPWWILLLRLLIAALVIVALARPLLNPSAALPGTGPVFIVIENGWAAAQTWRTQIEKAQDIALRAGREGRSIYIFSTAKEPGGKAPLATPPLAAAQAEATLRGMTPRPWPADYTATAAEIKKTEKLDAHVFWLSHGLADGKAEALSETLALQKGLSVFKPEAAQLPLLLRPPHTSESALAIGIDAPAALADGTSAAVHVLGANGKVLDMQQSAISTKKLPHQVEMTVPESLRGQITQFRLGGRKGAGAVILLDDQFTRRTVGILSQPGKDENAPLIEASFYIKRALDPYANIETGTAAELLDKKPSVIVLPDIGTLSPEDLNALEVWVKKGGLLLRFAGPNMSQADAFLSPVKLRQGGRALDGAMTWEKPLKLSPFAEQSPLFGLPVPEDVTVRRQVLPDQNMDETVKIWASLEDGTPLISAAALDLGLLVLVHTTATPEWSDLALSGTYVQILRRIVALAGSAQTPAAPTGQLQPLLVLDGMGNLQSPNSDAKPIDSAAFDALLPGPEHPPGLYGRAGYQVALNLGARINMPQALNIRNPAITVTNYGGLAEKDLMPFALACAFMLFLMDWILMIALQVSFRRMKWDRLRAACLAALMAASSFMPASSFAGNADDTKFASAIYLAYMRSGNSAVDSSAEAGLAALKDVLDRRTSVGPAGVVGLTPENDELSFFPFIYWPIAEGQADLSAKALSNVQRYLDNGGVILFDTRDQVSAPRSSIAGSAGGRNAATLRRLVGSLNIPALAPMKEDHVLGKSFYLMRSFPGRYDSGTLWVEQQSASGRDGVSSVIIGGHDWAYAWAAGAGSISGFGGGSARQNELALRFGVNVMIYALTGNYKADQVHLPHILERLGQ